MRPSAIHTYDNFSENSSHVYLADYSKVLFYRHPVYGNYNLYMYRQSILLRKLTLQPQNKNS